jgi:hypothetical protein
MSLEYVIVTFPTQRLVYIDGERSGLTAEVLRVNTGTHVFDLGRYANYEPASHEVLIAGTTIFSPIQIVFTKKVDT